ncbi:LOW QUALITY PROTEIN: hsp90-like protein, partial [Streptomyces sp. SPB074]
LLRVHGRRSGSAHVPGRPARPGRPPLPPSLRESTRLSARAAPERGGRRHGAPRDGPRRARAHPPAHRWRAAERHRHGHRPGRARHARAARDDRAQFQARRRNRGRPLGLPRPVRHWPARVLRRRGAHPRREPVGADARRRARRVDGARRRLVHGARPGRRGASRAGHDGAPGGAAWLRGVADVAPCRGAGASFRQPPAVRHPRGDASVTGGAAPWAAAYATPQARRAALVAHCRDVFGFAPLDTIDLDLPAAGVRGVAYVLPGAVSPARRAGHRVHLKGMLLTEQADALLPDWAFFVRCVLDTDTLRPTASREALYEDEALAAVRDALGARVRDWLTGLAASSPERLERFIATHHLGVKSLALHDAELLGTMLPWLPFETTDGRVPLTEFARRHRVVHFTRTVEEFRQVAAIASAQGIGVVNGGYTYDSELVERLPHVLPGATVAELDGETVTAHLGAVDGAEELALAPFLATARARLDALGCDVALRAFHPVTVPALHLDDRQARHEQARQEEAEQADTLWSGILGSLRGEAPRARLVLNHLNPLVRRVAALPNAELAGIAVEALYGQSLLMARRPLRPADSALLNRAFAGLLEWSTLPGGGAYEEEESR